jgi:hypothetical protein
MQLGMHVSKAHAHVSKTSEVRAIMDLQDVRAGSAFNACKTCGLVATVQQQYNTDPIDHSQDTATMPCDRTA